MREMNWPASVYEDSDVPQTDIMEVKRMRGTWYAMINRCYNPKCPTYHNYGGRGIRVCDSWRESFWNFYDDVGPRPSRRLSLDRIDNSKDYEPDNMRWATPLQQVNNRRKRNRVYGG